MILHAGKIIEGVHMHHMEGVMPLKTPTPRVMPDFLTAEQLRRYVYDGPVEDARAQRLDDLPAHELLRDRGVRRSARPWHPSSQSLESLASGSPSPPGPDEVADFADDFDSAFATAADPQAFVEDLDLDTAYEFYKDIVYAADGAPSSMAEALLGADGGLWREGLISEVKSHIKNKTLGPPLDKAPDGFSVVPLDVLCKIKRDGRRKVRAIIKGFRMQQGVHFNETFAPVPNLSSIRVTMALVAKYDLEFKAGDVETAFLKPVMDCVMYVSVPDFFTTDPDPNATGRTIRKLLKTIPGVPQGPRLFNKLAHRIFIGQGLVQCKSDFSLYACPERRLVLLAWVDDFFLAFPRETFALAADMWRGLQKSLDLGEWEDVADCLGCTVTRDRPNRTLHLSQRKGIDKLLSKRNMQDCEPKHTPMATSLRLTKKDCPPPEEKATRKDIITEYLSTVASCLHFVAWTRFDIALAVSKLCKFMHNPGDAHCIALKHLIRYLKGSRDKGLTFAFQPNGSSLDGRKGCYGYYDASHADCPDTFKSTLAYIFFFEGCPLSWSSKLHTLVTTSTNHSEYCAAAKTGREAKWLEKIFTFLSHADAVRPIDLFSDNKGNIAMAHNPVFRAASKHIALADHYARELVDLGTITISFVGTKMQLADMLTKALGRPEFERFASLCGLCIIP
jgi:hypothetical protein